MIYLKNTIIKNRYFILITFSAIFFIFFLFPIVPKYLSVDEVDFAKLSLSLAGKPYTPYSNLATGHSTLYFYLLLASLKTFGSTVFALRLPSALLGLISIIIFYKFIKKFISLENTVIAFFGAFFMLTSHWFLNFSRFSFEATFLVCLELLSIYFLYSYSQNNKKIYLFLSSLFAAFSFNSYTPGRIFIFVPLMIMLVKKKPTKDLLYYLIIFLLFSLPLILYLTKNPDMRINELTYLNKDYGVVKNIHLFSENIIKNIFMLFDKGDLNGRHNYPGKPALNLVEVVLFITGLFYSFRKWRRIIFIPFFSYFLVSLIPTALTIYSENPSMLRTFSTLPSIFIFITIGTLCIRNLIKSSKIFFIIILFAVVFSSLYEIRTYFKFQRFVFNKSFEIKTNLNTHL